METDLSSNARVASLLYQIAHYYELDGAPAYKVATYRKAAHSVERLEHPISGMAHRLESIPGIGKTIAGWISEFLQTGRSSLLEELSLKIPPEWFDLLRLPGVGPKMVRQLHQQLGVSTIADLEKAIEQKRIRKLPGLGPKTEQKLAASLQRWRETENLIPLGVALPVAETLKGVLDSHPEVGRVEIVGSLRRRQETVKKAHLLFTAEDPDAVWRFLKEQPFIENWEEVGETEVKFHLRYRIPIPILLSFVPMKQFGEALVECTGPREYWDNVREQMNRVPIRAEGKGEDAEGNEDEDFLWHRRFGLDWVPPELRELDLDSIVDKKGLELSEIRGDLHMHTTWSDGSLSLQKMAEAARQKGYEYIAITDHSKSLKIAGGLSVEQLRKQHEAIRELNKTWDDFEILTGVEMDILSEGVLDYPDDVIKDLDFVIGSIHSGFSQKEEQLTQRMVRAIENVHVDLIAHPTGRLIGRRDPYALKVEDMLEAARKTDTALEINANPNRLDLKDRHAQAAKELGIRIAINTDAHDQEELEFMRYGVWTGKRAGLTASDVLNTLTLHELRRWLQRH
jgi:DNA polymerase (family 10)